MLTLKLKTTRIILINNIFQQHLRGNRTAKQIVRAVRRDKNTARAQEEQQEQL